MAAYIPVPRDLSRVETRIILGLTRRQLICFGLAAAIGIPTFFLVRHVADNSVALMVSLILLMPIMVLTMDRRDGPPLEKMVWYFIQACFVRPKKRPYRTRNRYASLPRRRAAIEEVYEIVQHAMARQKRAGKHIRPSARAHPGGA